MATRYSFPDGFLWGTATAGHQVEGGNEHSNWWAWEQEGLVADGTRSGRACDYWNRYPEDHALMEQMGHNVFRLGVEWARIEPRRGEFDEAALTHYVEMLADLQSRGLQVCLTLNHWVLPQWFSERGGWCDAAAVEDWENFVRHVVPRLAPHVDLWITLNEPMVPALGGYLVAYHPPCRANPFVAAKVVRRLLAAHAVAYRAIHDLVPAAPGGGPTQVGFAAACQLFRPFHGEGFLRRLEDVIARVAARVMYRVWDLSVEQGRAVFPCGFGGRIPGLEGSLDFVGMNYYTRVSVRLSGNTFSNVKSVGTTPPRGIETTEMGWEVYPPGFHAVLMEAWERFRKPIYITENGCCETGDDMRRRYLLSHLHQVHRAIGDGADIRGYMLWSFMDNFEWREGFQKKFGIVEVDHADPDLRRRPRKSAVMYAAIIGENGLTDEIVDRFSPGALDPWR